MDPHLESDDQQSLWGMVWSYVLPFGECLPRGRIDIDCQPSRGDNSIKYKRLDGAENIAVES